MRQEHLRSSIAVTDNAGRVTNVLRTWVSDYLYDDEDERSFQAIVAFIETLPAETALQLSRILERRVSY